MTFLYLVRWTPCRWGFGSGWHFCQIFGSSWPLVRYTPAETSCGQVWYYFGTGWHLVRSLGQVDLWLDVPQQRHLVAKFVTTLGQAGWHLVRSLGQNDFWSDVPPGWGFGSGWHLVRCTPMMLQVRFIFSQTSGQDDLWSNVRSLGRVRLTFCGGHPASQPATIGKPDPKSDQMSTWPGSKLIFFYSIPYLWL